jgi:hypothetical protein
MKTTSTRAAATAAALTAAVALALTGCGEQEEVCQGRAQQYTLVPFTSTSDYATSRASTPELIKAIAGRAAGSCGSVGGGVATDRPESDLAVTHEQLVPTKRMAPNRQPYVRRMTKEAERHLDRMVGAPLARAKPTHGSPFLGALAKIAEESDWAGKPEDRRIVLVGDIVAIEPAPGRRMVDFRSVQVDQAAAEAFIPMLKPLAGTCVLAVGAGARSDLSPAVLRRARALMATVLAKAGIGFKAVTRGLPSGCDPLP